MRWWPGGRARRPSSTGPSPRCHPTQVRVDNEISSAFTVLDVFTEDKPGVLYTITRTLAEHGLDIHRSRVGVAGDRVADIFYVRDIATGARRRMRPHKHGVLLWP